MPDVPTVTLNTGHAMPQLGFGVWQIPDREAARTVGAALEAGYRSIDTAMIYGNERGCGEAIAAHVGADTAARRALFVTTKLWNDDQGYDTALRAFDASLARLGLDYVDLYLIHWPQPARGRFLDSWRALARLHREGRARAVGVSNFKILHLERLLAESDLVPAVNQIELHPALPQDDMVAFHQRHGIATEAYSPLARGELGSEVVGRLADKHGRAPAQIVLRWHMQRGIVAIPKSANAERIAANIALFDFALDEGDMAALAGLATGRRLLPDPDHF